MSVNYIYIVCTLCGGKKVVENSSTDIPGDTVPCPRCINSSGKMFFGWIQDEKEGEE